MAKAKQPKKTNAAELKRLAQEQQDEITREKLSRRQGVRAGGSRKGKHLDAKVEANLKTDPKLDPLETASKFERIKATKTSAVSKADLAKSIALKGKQAGSAENFWKSLNQAERTYIIDEKLAPVGADANDLEASVKNAWHRENKKGLWKATGERAVAAKKGVETKQAKKAKVSSLDAEGQAMLDDAKRVAKEPKPASVVETTPPSAVADPPPAKKTKGVGGKKGPKTGAKPAAADPIRAMILREKPPAANLATRAKGGVAPGPEVVEPEVIDADWQTKQKVSPAARRANPTSTIGSTVTTRTKGTPVKGGQMVPGYGSLARAGAAQAEKKGLGAMLKGAMPGIAWGLLAIQVLDLVRGAVKGSEESRLADVVQGLEFGDASAVRGELEQRDLNRRMQGGLRATDDMEAFLGQQAVSGRDVLERLVGNDEAMMADLTQGFGPSPMERMLQMGAF